jgi:hypothetical protein
MESDQTDCDHGSVLHDGSRIEAGRKYGYGICKVLLDIGMAVRYTIIAIEKGEYRGRGKDCGFGQMLRRCVQETKVLKGINFLGVNVNYFTK